MNETILPWSSNRMRIPPTCAPVVAVTTWTLGTSSLERQTADIIPRARAVVRAKYVRITEARETIVSVATGTISVAIECSFMRFVFGTRTVTQSRLHT